MRIKTKGSLTIEASFTITMVILVIGFMLSLWMYKFQMCWYTQGICECLLTGSNVGVLDEETYMDITRLKWEDIKQEMYLFSDELKDEITENKEEICMVVEGEIFLLGNLSLDMNIEQTISLVKPVPFIRQMSAVKEAIK